MLQLTRILAALIVTVAVFHVAGASADTTHVIDFSKHGGGPLDRKFFKRDGIVFSSGSYVGYVQGDDALVGPIAGKLSPKATGVSARIAPANQGTATYTLTTYDSAGQVVAATSVTVTQDLGDPANSGWGYFTLSQSSLPSNAASFEVTNAFVRSSYPNVTFVSFAVSSIAVTTTR